MSSKAIYDRLEKHYRDMQDVEFTIQDGKLYMLQTRSGKRTAQAAVRIAVEMVKEGLIDEKTALTACRSRAARSAASPEHQLQGGCGKRRWLTDGIAASPGAAVGRVVFNADDAEEWAARGEDVILVRTETSPEDIGGMDVAKSASSPRAAARPRTPPSWLVAWASAAWPAPARSRSTKRHASSLSDGKTVKEGDWITLDGSTGRGLPRQARARTA